MLELLDAVLVAQPSVRYQYPPSGSMPSAILQAVQQGSVVVDISELPRTLLVAILKSKRCLVRYDGP